MPITRRVLRGVQNIRTMSGRVDDRAIPYKAYMKLSVLEMEKYRRGKEKTTALERVQTIDERFRDIESEQQEITRSLESHGVPRPCRHRPTAPTAVPRRSTGSFKIRY